MAVERHDRPVQREGQATISDAALPRQVLEVELAGSTMAVGPSPASADPRAPALVLVRLHSMPLGWVTIASEAATDEAALLIAIADQLGPEVSAHLERDDLPTTAPDLADGVPWPVDVACLERRRALLASPPDVTVVVPVANRPDLLRLCLEGLAGQSYPAYDVLVVDNAPDRSDASRVVEAHNAANDKAVRYVAERREGSSRARNRGLYASTTTITAFVDADVRVDRHWLAELVLPLVEDARAACVTGLILPSELAEPGQQLMFEWGGYDQGFARREYELAAPAQGAPLHPYQPGVFGSGQSMAFRSEVLRAVGGFDHALGVRTLSQGGEDQAAMLDVVLDGWRLVYNPAAIVWHPDPKDVGDVLRKLNSYGVGLTALLTRTIVRRPRSAIDIVARLPKALAYFFAAGSGRNRRHSPGYPRRAVWSAELRGMAWGPVAYAMSVAAVPKKWRARPARTPTRSAD